MTWSDRTRSDTDSRRLGLLLLAIVAVGAVLRLVQLGARPLWIDEYATWKQIHPGPGHGFWEQVRDNVQGPLYLAILWPLRAWTPVEWWLRLPALVAGVASIPLAWLLGRRWATPRTGVWLALLVALNPFAVWYAQEARGYSLMLLCSLAATLVWLQAVQEGMTRRRMLAYAVCGWLAVLANMSALFLLAAQALTVLLVDRPRDGNGWRRWLLAYGLIGMGSLPWLLQAAGFWYPGRLAPGGGEIPPAGQQAFHPLAWFYTWFSFLYGFSLGPSLAELHRPDRVRIVLRALPLLGLAAGPVLVLGWNGLRRFAARDRWRLLLGLLVPMAILTVLRLLDAKTYNPRYLMTTLPLLLLVVARGLAAVRGRTGRLAAGLLLALTFLSVAQYHLSPRYARDDVRAAARWVAAGAVREEPILVPVVPNLFAFYYAGAGEVVPFWHVPVIRNREDARRVLAERLGDAPGAWLVLCRSATLDPRGLLEKELRATGAIVAEAAFPGVRVLHWRAVAASAGPLGE